VNKRYLSILTICIVLSVFLALSCGQKFDEDEDPSLMEIVKIGKKYLMKNQGAQAAEAFKVARDKCRACTDANFGLILAHQTQLINLVDEIINLASTLFYTAAPDPVSGNQEAVVRAQGSLIGDYIQEYLNDTVAKDFAENEMLYYEMEEELDEFLFEIAFYRIILDGDSLVSFEGEFDKTDLYFFGSISSLLNAVIEILLAHDLNFDFDAVVLPETTDTTEMILEIIDLLEGLLTDPEYPDFLKVKDTQGFQRMEKAGLLLGHTFERLAMMFDQLETERDYQFNDQIRYYDIDKDSIFDPETDPVQIVNLLTLDNGLAPILQELCVELSYAFWEGSDIDPHPYTLDTLNLGMFNDLLVNLGVFDFPILPEWLGVDVGSFFSNPSDDGLRTLLLALIDLVNFVIGLIPQ